MTKRLHMRGGLTLIEVAVALAISGMAMSVGYAALGTLVDRRSMVEDVTTATMRAWTARTRLTEWLGEVRSDPTNPKSFRGLDGARFGIPDDELTFLTTARTPLGDGEAFVRLYIARDSADVAQGLAADLWEWRGTHRITVLIDSTVAGLDVRFRSSLSRTTLWLNSWVSSSILPAGVEIKLLPAPTGRMEPLLGVPMLVPLR